MRLSFFADRQDDRTVLTIPTHELVDHQHHWHEVEPVLRKAAQQIVDSGLVWRWNRYDGKAKLVRWSDVDPIFVGFSIDDFRGFLGQHWRVVDTAGMEWAGPSRAVGDRLYAAVLANPNLPLASWQLQSQRQHDKAP